MSDFLLSQALVSIALFFDAGSQQFKQRHYLISAQAFAAVLIAWHFFLINADTAGYMFGLAAIRLSISLKWRNKTILYFFLACAVITAAYSYNGYLTLFSCAASLLMTISSFAHTDKQLRHFMIMGSSIWLIHNILVLSPVAILMELLFFGSAVLGYYRFYWRGRSQQHREND